MELRPHLMIEATLIAMRALAATEGYIYLREEYATSRNRLSHAIEEFRAAGLLDGLSLELVIGAAPTSPARRRRCSSRWKGAARCPA